MNRKLLTYSSLFFTCLLIDRITKAFAVSHFKEQGLTLFPGFNLTLIFNRGISWGMLNFESTPKFRLLTLLIISVVLAFLYFAVQHYQKDEFLLGETLVLTGAISNIIDRFIYGGVVDFIHISWPLHWPVFNIADSFIVVGIGLILYKQWRTL